MRASEHLENKTSKLDPSAIKDRKENLQIWNRMARIFDYPSVLETVKDIQAAGLALDIFIYNTLINKAPDYEEAKALVDTMRGEGIPPNVFTYSTLAQKYHPSQPIEAAIASYRKGRCINDLRSRSPTSQCRLCFRCNTHGTRQGTFLPPHNRPSFIFTFYLTVIFHIF